MHPIAFQPHAVQIADGDTGADGAELAFLDGNFNRQAAIFQQRISRFDDHAVKHAKRSEVPAGLRNGFWAVGITDRNVGLLDDKLAFDILVASHGHLPKAGAWAVINTQGYIEFAGLVIGRKGALFDFRKGKATFLVISNKAFFGIKHQLGIGRRAGNDTIFTKINRFSIAQSGVRLGEGKYRPLRHRYGDRNRSGFRQFLVQRHAIIAFAVDGDIHGSAIKAFFIKGGYEALLIAARTHQQAGCAGCWLFLFLDQKGHIFQLIRQLSIVACQRHGIGNRIGNVFSRLGLGDSFDAAGADIIAKQLKCSSRTGPACG